MPPKIEGVKLSTSPKKYLFDSVFSQTQLSRQYVVQLIFSTIITTLGLITNNIVVVVGAMLLSPLFWPVLGIALGIITTRRNILKNAITSFLVSAVVVLIFSTFIGFLLPINELSPEITSRINPNLIDLFIALAASIIGVFALYYPTISATTAGVAISISLLPPLCIVGIGLAKLSGKIIFRSLLLFGTNTGAIVFVGVIALYILKIRPRKAEEEVRFKYGVLISGILMLVLSIPLSIYLKESIITNIVTSEVNTIINERIKQISSDARVEKVNIDFLSIGEDTPLDVDAVIYLPEGVFITRSQKEQLLNYISTKTKRDVSLKFNIISTLSLQTEEDKQKSLLRQGIREIIFEEFEEFGSGVVIDNIEITFPMTKTDPQKQDVDILILVKQYGVEPLTYDDRQNLKDFLEFKLNIIANIEIEFIPISRLKETPLEVGNYEKVNEGLESILEEISDGIYIDEVSIKEGSVYVKLFSPSYVVINQAQKGEMEKLIVQVLGEKSELSLQIVRYEQR